MRSEGMGEGEGGRPLVGWQRAYVLAAAEYVREQALKSPADEHAGSVYAALLEVLDPARRAVRLRQERRAAGGANGSMWEQRSGSERRVAERRTLDAPPSAGGDRRKALRRGARDRRERSG